MAAASLSLDSVSVDQSTGVATITVNTDTISGTMFLRVYETDPGVVTASDVYSAPTDSTSVTASPVVFTVPNNGWNDTDYYAVVQRTAA